MSSETPHADAKIFDRRLAVRMARYVRPYILYILIALAGLVLMAAIQGYLPVVIKQIIDRYLVAENSTLSAADRWAGTLRLGGMYFALAAVGFAARYGQGFVMAWVGQHVLRDLRTDLYKKILRMPLSYMDRMPIGRLMTRVSSDVEAMERWLTDGLVGLLADLFTIMGVIIFMFILSPQLATVLCLTLPLLFFFIGWINRHIRLAHRGVRKQQSGTNAFLQESITGMQTIQLFGREAYMQRRFDDRNDQLRGAWYNSINWVSCFFPSMEVFRALSVALIFISGAAALSFGIGDVTAGVLVAFIYYVRDFYNPLQDLSDKSNVFQSAMASSELIFDLLDEDERVCDPARPLALDEFKGAVQFEHVWFAYQNEDWVLRDFSLTIPAGQSVALVGATGSGKTTIVSLLTRFYDIRKGSIKVDGKELREVAQHDLRMRIGVVLQDPFIFSGTIAGNISMSDPAVTRAEIEKAATYVNAHGFISDLPQGYDTPVFERGASLSTGQKQLIALARAIVQNPDILLIMDEATASVDTETEGLIKDALEKLMHGRTSIIIAHRLSTIKGADMICVMRRGEMIEQGSHRELLKQEGHYRHLYDLLSISSTF